MEVSGAVAVVLLTVVSTTGLAAVHGVPMSLVAPPPVMLGSSLAAPLAVRLSA